MRFFAWYRLKTLKQYAAGHAVSRSHLRSSSAPTVEQEHGGSNQVPSPPESQTTFTEGDNRMTYAGPRTLKTESRLVPRYSAYHDLAIIYEGHSEEVPVRVPDISTKG